MSGGDAPVGSRGTALRGDIAIIGMACVFPGAPDLDTYWQNIVSKTDAITDPPPDAWDQNVFYDPDSAANDRVYCKRGGYLADLARFNPLEYGIMPVTVDGGEPDQWLALQVAHTALTDAGYQNRPKERGRTELILGKGTYINRGNLTIGYHGLIIEQVLQILRSLHPDYAEAELQAIKRELKASLPPFSAETAPALIGNIIAGRVANRLDLMGPTCTVDAACASALLATEIGLWSELAARIDPRGLGDMLRKLQNDEQKLRAAVPQLHAFSSHPAIQKRIQRLEEKWTKLKDKSFKPL